MPKYVLPAADAVARAKQANLSFLAPLRACLIGPRAGLHRYSVTAERASLGEYDPLSDTTYEYPDRSAGSTIDLASVKLYASTADLNYFNKYVGVNGSCQPSSAYPNRVRAANFVFKTANSTSRSSDFYDRDVKVGDIAYVRGTADSVTYELTTSVTGFVGETVAASTGAATADAANPATQVQSDSIEQVDDTPVNDVVATIAGTGYESTADGYINRTYTITVTQSSTGNDATTALLRVRSSDGLDDQDDVSPAAFGAATAIGTKGLEVTWDIDTGNSSSSLYGIDEDDFVVGQQWTATVGQAFTKPTATAAGTYTGTKTTTYIVTITRGGLFAASTKPQFTVTANNGYDSSGPTSILAGSTAYAVGSYGVTVSFSGTYVRKGDKYYIVATAASEGAVRTLVLQDDVPEEIRGEEVDLRLFARRTDLEIPRIRTEPTTTTNWTRDDDEVVVTDAISVIDSEFTDGDDNVPIPIDSATLYLEYREWVTTGSGTRVVLSDPADITASLGTVDPDNPIAYAASKALANTAGELAGDPTRPASDTTDQVYCVALGGDPADTDLWTSALELIENEEDVYQLVPLSTDTAVHALFTAHVSAQSTAAVGFFRTVWLPASLDETGAVVSDATSSDEEAVTATMTDDGSGEFLTVTASANALFVTNGVRAGDVLRINFGTDAFGEQTYDEYVVDTVTSETTLSVTTGPDDAISVAVMAEVWRDYTKAEMVTQITAVAAGHDSDRVKYVWPDAPGFGGDTLAGYTLSAALAGLTGSVPSNQGVRNVGVEGFDDLTRSSRFFNNAQLKDLADGGVFVVTQTPDGRPYVAYPNTTDVTSVATREEVVVRNADMLRKAVQAEWAPYIGAGNVVSNIRQLLEGALMTLVNQLKSASNVDQLGPPIADLRISSLTIAADAADTLEVELEAVGLPAPLNYIQLTLPVSL